MHQGHAGWGIGVSDSALRDVKMVKDAGMNFIRSSHYPKAPAFADACDQLGVLFWSENNLRGGFGGTWNPYNWDLTRGGGRSTRPQPRTVHPRTQSVKK